MKILFVSPEVSPFARTGGLGEVVGRLPIALRKMGVDARIICPLHRCCKDLPLNNISGEISFPSKHSKIRSKIAQKSSQNGQHGVRGCSSSIFGAILSPR